MEKKLLFIYNPRAGKTGYTSHLTEIFRVFIDAGYRVEVFPTGERGDGREYARGIGDDFDLVVAAGGKTFSFDSTKVYVYPHRD